MLIGNGLTHDGPGALEPNHESSADRTITTSITMIPPFKVVATALSLLVVIGRPNGACHDLQVIPTQNEKGGDTSGETQIEKGLQNGVLHTRIREETTQQS